MCAELWVGWFDAWRSGKHHTTDADQAAKELREVLEGGSVNLYVAEGGTNFGFMNGSNYGEFLTPDVTSYDYDALLTEDGQITEKYKKCQQVIAEFEPLQEVELLPPVKRSAYGEAPVVAKTDLFHGPAGSGAATGERNAAGDGTDGTELRLHAVFCCSGIQLGAKQPEIIQSGGPRNRVY